MNKEQQIEEMARDIYEQKSCDTSFEENCKTLAYDLVALGYQKIDKDSAVLSREEQEKILTATEKRIKELKRQILQARKETAEKFYDKVNENICVFQLENKNQEFTDGYAQAIADICGRLDQVAKQFGVEIKE